MKNKIYNNLIELMMLPAYLDMKIEFVTIFQIS